MIKELRDVIQRLHYPIEVMLVCARWYAAYPLSRFCRDSDARFKSRGDWPMIKRPASRTGMLRSKLWFWSDRAVPS